MSGTVYEQQRQIRTWLGLYLDEFGMTSTREIARWIEERVNYKVSHTTIHRLVQKFGYTMKRGEWLKK
jgi:transposase-like protein